MGEAADWRPFDLESFRQSARRSLPAAWRGLAYHRLADGWLAFEFAEQGVRAHRLNLSANDEWLIERAAEPGGELRATLLRHHGYAMRRRLYDVLIPESTAQRLAPAGFLLILPHGPLHALPFHALQAPGGRYLAEQAVVGYAPSLLTLGLLAEREAARAPARAPSLFLAACGVAEPGTGPLPYAKREADGLRQSFGPNAVYLADQEATGNALRHLSRTGELAGFDFVHMIAHGEFDARNSRGSGLLLADGGLLVDDVADLHLNARVVTLSACEGGLREVYAGEEWVGLPQAFLSAGARCVISSLWGLPDRAMPWPIWLIYHHLLAGQGPALALALAQRNLMRIHREPYYWAALTAVGLP
jgi:CHAT domain-containing protein